MENKINIAELLEDCPKGTKLYSPIFGEVYLGKIRPHLGIVVTTDKEQGDFKEEFLYDGRYGMNGECMLFPSKDQRDWSKFQRPFIDGDIVVCTNKSCTFTAIFKSMRDGSSFYRYGVMYDNKFRCLVNDWSDFNDSCRLATEEEKTKLFDAIKANGYKWNPETKTLEKLVVKPKFKVGDIIQDIIGICKVKITEVNVEEEYYLYKSLAINGIGSITFNRQDEWELVSNKFDINTLKPFDKVLVRDNNTQKWTADLFSFYDRSLVYPYSCVGHYTNQCVPYEKNEHLLGTTNDCDEYYKNW